MAKAPGFFLPTHLVDSGRNVLEIGAGTQSPRIVVVDSYDLRRSLIPFPNGTYDGGWIEGHMVDHERVRVRHGKGTMRYFNGNVYSGDWLNDCFNGIGQYTWADGRVFNGQFKDDKINGKGVGVWPDGKRYEGDYVNDLAEGHGVVTLSDGRLFEGR